jgi:CheY-like chemotaxis protein
MEIRSKAMLSTNSEQGHKARNAVNPYVRLFLWPLVLLAVLSMFHSPLSNFLERLNKAEITKDAKGFKIALAAANLAAAEASRSEPTSNNRKSVDPEGVAQATSRAAGSLTVSQAKVLWVDDNPDNQQYERNALGALGITFDLARNTDEAMARLKVKKFNLIITDFKRTDDPQGAHTLLEKLKKISSPPPVIIYSGSSNPDFEKEAKRKGAYGETNSPQRLFNLVVNALLDK